MKYSDFMIANENLKSFIDKIVNRKRDNMQDKIETPSSKNLSFGDADVTQMHKAITDLNAFMKSIVTSLRSSSGMRMLREAIENWAGKDTPKYNSLVSELKPSNIIWKEGNNGNFRLFTGSLELREALTYEVARNIGDQINQNFGSSSDYANHTGLFMEATVNTSFFADKDMYDEDDEGVIFIRVYTM